MKTIQIDNNVVCYDDYDLDNKPELKELVEASSLKKLLDSVHQDVTLVLGGDGIMLEAIRNNYTSKRAFLPMNFGTVGFLLNDKKWISESSSFTERQYPLLEIKKDGKVLGIGCNDVNLYSPTGKLTRLDISLEGMGKLSLSGDGAIIATPAGSTGHSKSYFGPVIPHVNKALIITPKGNSTPESAKVVTDDRTITVENTGRIFDLGINLDGVQVYQAGYGESVKLEINKLRENVTFLISKDHESDWDAKVMSHQGFKI